MHQIGVGVLGPVFRAQDSVRDQLVAVKMFRLDAPPEQAAQIADALQALVSALPRHSSLLPLVSAGVERDMPYLVMTHSDVPSLDTRLKPGVAMEPEEAMGIVRMVAEAIDAAHARDIVHGSLHPRDIFVDEHGDVRVSGFGVGAALVRAGLRAPVRRPYSAPERLMTSVIEPAADRFALGAIAFELLSGRRLVGTGRDAAARCVLPASDGDAPAADAEYLRTALAAMLAENPVHRPSRASAFAQSLAVSLFPRGTGGSRGRARAGRKEDSGTLALPGVDAASTDGPRTGRLTSPGKKVRDDAPTADELELFARQGTLWEPEARALPPSSLDAVREDEADPLELFAVSPQKTAQRGALDAAKAANLANTANAGESGTGSPAPRAPGSIAPVSPVAPGSVAAAAHLTRPIDLGDPTPSAFPARPFLRLDQDEVDVAPMPEARGPVFIDDEHAAHVGHAGRASALSAPASGAAADKVADEVKVGAPESNVPSVESENVARVSDEIIAPAVVNVAGVEAVPAVPVVPDVVSAKVDTSNVGAVKDDGAIGVGADAEVTQVDVAELQVAEPDAAGSDATTLDAATLDAEKPGAASLDAGTLDAATSAAATLASATLDADNAGAAKPAIAKVGGSTRELAGSAKADTQADAEVKTSDEPKTQTGSPDIVPARTEDAMPVTASVDEATIVLPAGFAPLVNMPGAVASDRPADVPSRIAPPASSSAPKGVTPDRSAPESSVSSPRIAPADSPRPVSAWTGLEPLAAAPATPSSTSVPSAAASSSKPAAASNDSKDSTASNDSTGSNDAPPPPSAADDAVTPRFATSIRQVEEERSRGALAPAASVAGIATSAAVSGTRVQAAPDLASADNADAPPVERATDTRDLRDRDERTTTGTAQVFGDIEPADTGNPFRLIALVLAIGLAVGGAAGYLVGKRGALQTDTVTTVPETAPIAGAGSDAPAGASSAPPASRAANAAPASAGSAAASAPPAASSGRLVIRSTPSRAEVAVGGTRRGLTPLTIRNLPLGSHLVRVTRSGYAPEARRVTLSATRAAESLTFDLERVAAPARTGAAAPARPSPVVAPPASAATAPAPAANGLGALYVLSRPAGARVMVDGRPVGVTPLLLQDIAPGARVIRLEMAGHRPWTDTVQVVAGQRVRVAASLEEGSQD